MKNRTLTLTSLFSALALLVLTLGSGCSSMSGGAYKLKQTRDDVDWAMTRYHNRLPFGFITPSEQQQVTAAYTSYQTAFNAAAKQANSNYNLPTPDNVKQLADQLLGILDSIP